MKNVMLSVAMATLVLGGLALAGEPAPQKVKDLAASKLAGIGSDPLIVAAVQAANAEGRTLDQIKTKDAEWQKTAGVVDYMQALMESECGKHLREVQASAPYFAEIFVMDNQGANVAMTDKTSDYWQGDEPKFQESFKGGAGAVHIGDVKFDDSTQAYLVQVSVPVLDGGKAIGAITFGVDVDQVD
jgi:hypothetical protein